MATIRVAKRARFTTVDRETIRDASLSYRARGVLVWLLDKPNDWHTSAEGIAQHGTEGRDAIRAALRELQNAGYLRRAPYRDDAGKWATEWTVYERPQRETSAGLPSTVSQASSTEEQNEKEKASLSRANAQPNRFPGELDQVSRCPKCRWITQDCTCEKVEA